LSLAELCRLRNINRCFNTGALETAVKSYPIEVMGDYKNVRSITKYFYDKRDLANMKNFIICLPSKERIYFCNDMKNYVMIHKSENDKDYNLSVLRIVITLSPISCNQYPPNINDYETLSLFLEFGLSPVIALQFALKLDLTPDRLAEVAKTCSHIFPNVRLDSLDVSALKKLLLDKFPFIEL
jgi:hypothetical protein